MSNEEVVEKVLKCLHCGYEWVEEVLDIESLECPSWLKELLKMASIQCPNCLQFDETGELFIELDKKMDTYS